MNSKRRITATLLAVLALFASAGCTIVVPTNSGARSVYVLGFARVKVPQQSRPSDTTAFELSGLGVAVGRLVQLGYFREFQVELIPGSNAALVLVRSPEELEHLQQTIEQLNERGLCIVSKS